MHFALHTSRYTLHTPLWILYASLHATLCTPRTWHSTPCTLHLTLHTYIPHASHSTLRASHSTPDVLHFTLRTLHFTLCTPHFALCTSHPTVTPHLIHCPHLTLHTLPSTLYTPHSTLHTLHFRLYTSTSTIHTSHTTATSRTLCVTLHTPHLTLPNPQCQTLLSERLETSCKPGLYLPFCTASFQIACCVFQVAFVRHSSGPRTLPQHQNTMAVKDGSGPRPAAPLPILHSRHSTLHTGASTLCTPHLTLYILRLTLHTSHSTLYSTLRTSHPKLQDPHFTLYTSLHSTLYTSHFTSRTLHSTFYSPQPTYTRHPTPHTHNSLSALLISGSVLYTCHLSLPGHFSNRLLISWWSSRLLHPADLPRGSFSKLPPWHGQALSGMLFLKAFLWLKMVDAYPLRFLRRV